MRRTSWLLAAAIIGLAGTAVGYQPNCASCNGGATARTWAQKGFDAEACGAPCGYSLVPGCCEDTRHCCDNAWAGYCDHRAKVEAFWARVGVPGSCGRGRVCRGAPMGSCCPSNVAPASVGEPTPAIPTPAHTAMPAPPAPAKAGR
jgi:hypothetical protein